jgi:hypothetical protein
MSRFRNGLAAIALVTAMLAAGGALAQGSAGGSVGNRGKSVSGESDSAPAATPARRAKPKRSSDEASSSRRASIAGTWRWVADCERGVRHFEGLMIFQQVGNEYTGAHGGTNFFDTGTVSNVKVGGNRVSFTRKWGRYVDHLDLRVSGGRMSGVIPNTEYSGRCELVVTKQ